MNPRHSLPRLKPDGSETPTVPHGVLDLGSVANTHIAQGPVIELCQSADSTFYLALVAPVGPRARNQIPELLRGPANDTN
jgi:hypothetical protein